MSTLVSVNVGLPRDVQWQGRTVRTAIWKEPVRGRVFAGRLNLAGDGQADTMGHGGEQRAVMVYQLDSYEYWKSFLGRPDLAAWQLRREPHRRRPARQRRLHRRSVPHRRRRVRGHAAAGHVLPPRHPDESAGHAVPGRRPWTARLLPARDRGRRGLCRRRHREGRGRSRAHQRGRDQRAALFAGSSGWTTSGARCAFQR